MLLCKSISFASGKWTWTMLTAALIVARHPLYPLGHLNEGFSFFMIFLWVHEYSSRLTTFSLGVEVLTLGLHVQRSSLHHGGLTKYEISKFTHWKGALRLFGTPEHDDNCRLTIPFLMRFTHGWLIRSVPSYPLPLRKKNRKSHHMSAYTNHARKEFRKEPSHFRLGWYIQPWILDLLTFFTIFFHLL